MWQNNKLTMVRFSFSRILMVAMMSVSISCVLHTGCLMVSAFAEQDEEVRTLEVNEVKEEGEGYRVIIFKD